MLPKLASHILHQTSRAAAAVQSQSSYIRNVLQLQSSSGTSTSTSGLGGWNGAGSSWGSQGTNAGGAKYHGSRFYNNYNGAGRAFTQANASTSQDGTSGQCDDTDELKSKRVSLLQIRKPRLRSNSLSINIQGRLDRGEKLGVLETVQMHAKFRHAFASDSARLMEPIDAVSTAEVLSSPSRLVLVRRNSTSVPITAPDEIDEHMLHPLRPPNTDPPPRPPETTTATFTDEERDPHFDSPVYIALKAARDSHDNSQVIRAVEELRATAVDPTVYEYNMALEGLSETRIAGEPLTLLLETYNEMVSRSIYPNIKTYLVLIQALVERDHEIYKIIMSAEMWRKRRASDISSEITPSKFDDKQIGKLRQENNFRSAMVLFEIASSITAQPKIPPLIYRGLLKSAGYNANVDAALSIFAHLEKRRDILPAASIYALLINVYICVGDTNGAKEVFDEFRSASRDGRVAWEVQSAQLPNTTAETTAVSSRGQLWVWNKMIEAYFRGGQPVNALSLLEQMMDTKNGTVFDPGEPPLPGSSTYTNIISGFCRLGDTKTALAWFDRLLQQEGNTGDQLEHSVVAPRLDQAAWAVMLEYLAEQDMLDDLNRIFIALLQNATWNQVEIRAIDRVTTYRANMRAVDAPGTSDDSAITLLDFVSEKVLPQDPSIRRVMVHESESRSMLQGVLQRYLNLNCPDKAYRTFERHIRSEMQRIRSTEGSNTGTAEMHRTLGYLRSMICEFTPSILDSMFRSQKISFDIFQIARLSDSVDMLPQRQVAPYYLHAFALGLAVTGTIDLSLRDWELLLHAASICDIPQPAHKDLCPQLPGYAFVGTAALLESLASHHIPLEKVNPTVVHMVRQALLSQHSEDYLHSFLNKLGPSYVKFFNIPSASQASPTTPVDSSIRCDVAHSRHIDQHFPVNPTVSPLDAYARFETGLNAGKYPIPATIARLINSLGRLGEFEKVRALYDAGQLVLSSLHSNKELQLKGWFQIEDSMIVAYAHGGNIDAAHVHRERILGQGGAPSADAYGALIQSVKDTTDDCSNALALWRESQMKGVTPSIYLFNTIISKLAKARKADSAIELFKQMKGSRLSPSSITFGAVIAACARVGDANSAELLFQEMTQQANFKPRIPPYNTMIQMYTTTKPNRDRALHFYEELCLVGIAPTSHTYKLLLDVYGTIEPIEVEAMEEVFKKLEESGRVAIQGTHWASLINAYGCVQKDLERAITVFNSIEKHPSTAKSSSILPDAVTYEALINVLVTHRRTDLIPQYIERLQASKVHMTAYIANFMIKGYAASGDLVKAREVFEGLEDPPEGVAAPNNHAQHQDGQSSTVGEITAVYREPSTWEAMVRAELGSGNRTIAIALIKRLESRKFPAAVQNRISGIMLDDSVSPWPLSPTSSDNQTCS